jgi:hypothetical protein
VIPVRGIQDDQLAECEATLIEAAASEELAGTPMVRMLPQLACGLRCVAAGCSV